MKKLDYVGFIDPRLINNLPIQARVENGRIEVGGMKFWFTGEPYAEGARVEVKISNRMFVAESLDERAARLQAQHEAEKERKLKEARELKRCIEEAKQFNTSLNIPVAWGGVIKTVLSGLSESSWGDGQNRATVVHIEVHEPLEAGCLKREPGELLCGVKSSRMYNAEASIHGPHARKVTCKGCLRIAKRWQS